MYARQAKHSFEYVYRRKSKLKLSGNFNDSNPDGAHILSFPALVDMLNKDFEKLDAQSYFDIHFHSYDTSCHVCEVPYKYIIRLEARIHSIFSFVQEIFEIFNNIRLT